MSGYNPWHGCHKLSAGCQHCFIYSMDRQYDRDASIVTKTKNFDLPLRKNARGEYVLKADDGAVFTCLSSDFFIEEADQWRGEVWEMIRMRPDLAFNIITKRIDRFKVSLPDDWQDGYPNVTIISTVEDQLNCDHRLPILLKMPIMHRQLNCEPLLGPIELSGYLAGGQIEAVAVGGESGRDARVCDYAWVLDIRRQCIANDVSFWFHQTGANFRKDGRQYHIAKHDQHQQARKSAIDFEARR